MIGPATTLSLFNNDAGQSGREVLYGTSDGKIGLIELSFDEPVSKWEHLNEKRLAGITSIDSFDITNDGILDLIVSREDGVIEVFVYDSMDYPVLKYNYAGQEGVSCVQGGCIGTSGYDELVVGTYNGWIFGLTTESYTKELANVPASISMDKDTSEKMNRLKYYYLFSSFHLFHLI